MHKTFQQERHLCLGKKATTRRACTHARCSFACACYFPLVFLFLQDDIHVCVHGCRPSKNFPRGHDGRLLGASPQVSLPTTCVAERVGGCSGGPILFQVTGFVYLCSLLDTTSLKDIAAVVLRLSFLAGGEFERRSFIGVSHAFLCHFLRVLCPSTKL